MIRTLALVLLLCWSCNADNIFRSWEEQGSFYDVSECTSPSGTTPTAAMVLVAPPAPTFDELKACAAAARRVAHELDAVGSTKFRVVVLVTPDGLENLQIHAAEDSTFDIVSINYPLPSSSETAVHGQGAPSWVLSSPDLLLLNVWRLHQKSKYQRALVIEHTTTITANPDALAHPHCPGSPEVLYTSSPWEPFSTGSLVIVPSDDRYKDIIKRLEQPAAWTSDAGWFGSNVVEICREDHGYRDLHIGQRPGQPCDGKFISRDTAKSLPGMLWTYWTHVAPDFAAPLDPCVWGYHRGHACHVRNLGAPVLVKRPGWEDACRVRTPGCAAVPQLLSDPAGTRRRTETPVLPPRRRPEEACRPSYFILGAKRAGVADLYARTTEHDKVLRNSAWYIASRDLATQVSTGQTHAFGSTLDDYGDLRDNLATPSHGSGRRGRLRFNQKRNSQGPGVLNTESIAAKLSAISNATGSAVGIAVGGAAVDEVRRRRSLLQDQGQPQPLGQPRQLVLEQTESQQPQQPMGSQEPQGKPVVSFSQPSDLGLAQPQLQDQPAALGQTSIPFQAQEPQGRPQVTFSQPDDPGAALPGSQAADAADAVSQASTGPDFGFPTAPAGVVFVKERATKRLREPPVVHKPHKFDERIVAHARTAMNTWFPKPHKGEYVGDATSDYLVGPETPYLFPVVCPESSKDFKFIVVLREPVARMQSDHQLRVRLSKFKLGYADPVINSTLVTTQILMSTLPDNWAQRGMNPPIDSNLVDGIYVAHLNRWLSVFPRQAFLIVCSETLWAGDDASKELYMEIQRFIGVSDPLDVMPRNKADVLNRVDRALRPEQSISMQSLLARRLRDFYRPFVRTLAKDYPGVSCPWFKDYLAVDGPEAPEAVLTPEMLAEGRIAMGLEEANGTDRAANGTGLRAGGGLLGGGLGGFGGLGDLGGFIGGGGVGGGSHPLPVIPTGRLGAGGLLRGGGLPLGGLGAVRPGLGIGVQRGRRFQRGKGPRGGAKGGGGAADAGPGEAGDKAGEKEDNFQIAFN